MLKNKRSNDDDGMVDAFLKVCFQQKCIIPVVNIDKCGGDVATYNMIRARKQKEAET